MILIARGLLKKDANIFIFDEVTPNLPTLTEHEFLMNLSIQRKSISCLKDKTFIFAYSSMPKLSMEEFDQIFVLKKQKVLEVPDIKTNSSKREAYQEFL